MDIQLVTASSQRVQIVGIVSAAAATGIVLMLPTPEQLPVQGHRMAALFIGMLVLWSTEALPIAITSLLALALQPVFQLTAILAPGGPQTVGAIMTAAAANFISNPFFFVLVMFTIAFAWVKTGLARRFALWMMSLAGTDSRNTVYVFVVGTGLISTIVSDVPAAAIFMAIALGIFDKLNIRPGSNLGKAVMMGIPIGSLIGGVGTPAGSSINLLGLSIIEANGGARVPFLHWMAIGIPMIIILLPIRCLGAREALSAGDQSNRRALTTSTASVGPSAPLTLRERKVIGFMAVLMVLWISSTWIPALDIFMISILGGCAMFLPGVGLFTWKEVQNATGWDTLMMIGAVTSLGTASSRTGLAKWLADTALGGIQDSGALAVIAAISAFTVAIHLLLPSQSSHRGGDDPADHAARERRWGESRAVRASSVFFTASCAFLLPLDAVPLRHI